MLARAPLLLFRAKFMAYGAGIWRDIEGRIPHYLSDWADGLSPKALSAGVFIFFSQAIPATVFAAYLSARTDGQLGVAEVLLSMGLGGALFSLLAGQPLVIVGVTGPVCILLATTAELAARWGLPLRGWLLAACLWATLFHALLALASAPRAFSRAVTAFSGDVFGALIGLIYVIEGATVLLEPLAAHSSSSTSVLALCLGIACVGLAGALSCARAWSPLARANGLLEDYALPLAVVISTLLSRAPAWADAARTLPLLPVGSGGSSIGSGMMNALATAAALPAWAAAAAALPGGMLTALLFFDHNISAMLCQAPRFALRKPPSYDWDFLLLGLSIALTGCLGLPPNYGLLPQAPMHTAALATFADAGGGGSGEPAVTAVCENRISAALQSVLLLALLAPPLLQGALGAVPLGVLGGLLVFLGLAGLAGNGAVSRWGHISACCRRAAQQQQRPPPSRAALVLGASQLLLVAAIYGLTRTPVGLLFPALILALPPLRAFVLPWVLGRSEVEAEDPGDWGRGASGAADGVVGMEAAYPVPQGATSPKTDL